MLERTRSRRTLVVLLLLGIWGGWAATAAGGDVEAVSSRKETGPGGFVTHVFDIRNTGSEQDTYAITVDVPSGWSVLGVPGEVTLPAGGEQTVFVTLTTPASTLAGEYSITLVLSSTSTLDQSVAEATVLVEPFTEIEVIPPEGQSVTPGETLSYAFLVVNRGNAQEKIEVTLSSSRRFGIEADRLNLELAPQERAEVPVQVSIPIDASPGRDVLSALATSSIYAGVEDQAVVFTTVLPPPPQAVGGTLMAVLPARLKVSLDKDVMTGAFDSRLSFSVSGRVLGGYFSSAVSASYPFGPLPLDISSYSLLYRLDPVRFSLGNVSESLTDLIALSCEGAGFELDTGGFDLGLVAGGSAGKPQFAGHAAIGPDAANVGLGYYDERAAAQRSAMWTATAQARLLEEWSLRLEAGLGTIDGKIGRGIFFNTTLDVPMYFFSGDIYSVGTYMPGPLQDEAGIALNQRLRLEALSIGLSIAHQRDNVIDDPLLPTSISDRLGFNLTATPFEDGPTLSATTEFEWARYADLYVKDDVSSLLSIGLSQSDGAFPYAFSGESADRIDRVQSTHHRTWTFSEGVGLSIDSFYLFLEATQESVVDVIHDVTLSSVSDVSLVFRPEGTIHEATIRFQNQVDDFDLSASLFVHYSDALDFVLDGSIAWDRDDTSDIAFGWGVSMNASFDLPLPFLVTKGRLAGHIFADANGNGRFDDGDRAIQGAIVSANQTEVSTDNAGFYRFPPLPPGTYDLGVRQLPPDVRSRGTLEITVRPGSRLTVDIPVGPVTLVEGVVFNDDNRDGVMQSAESGLTDVRIRLEGTERSQTVTTDVRGRFAFYDVAPGQYVVSVDAGSLPDRFVFTTQETADVAVSDQPVSGLTFGGYVRPREIVITFQPPTADFTFSPQQPIAGGQVAFDAGLSFDFDGELVRYEWDFDGDGAADADGVTVQYVFETSGTYWVALTVTDNEGNTDTLERSISVSPVVPQGSSFEPAETFQPPIADFSFAPDAPIAGTSVVFDATSSVDPDGTLTAFAWDFDGDGQPDATGPSAVHTFDLPGTYPVTLEVTDDQDNVDRLTQDVVVRPASAQLQESATSSSQTFQPPIADFSFAPDVPIAGTSVVFDATSSVDPDGTLTAFAWDFDGDGQADATGPSAVQTFDLPGTYPVTLEVTDDQDNVDRLTQDVVVHDGSALHQPPVASFTYAPEAPSWGDTVVFDAAGSNDPDGTLVAYQWDLNNDGQSDVSGASIEYAFPGAGAYPVRLTVIDEQGNTASVTRMVTIASSAEGSSTTAPLSQPPIADFSYSPAAPAPGEAVRFDGRSSLDFDGVVVGYRWDFDDDGQTDAEGALVEYTFSTSGLRNVSLTVEDDTGNQDTVTYPVTIVGSSTAVTVPPIGTAQPPIADFQYMPFEPAMAEPVMFNAMSSIDVDGSIVDYAWDFNADGQPDATDAIAVYVFSSPGPFDVTLTVYDNEGNSDRITRTLVVQ